MGTCLVNGQEFTTEPLNPFGERWTPISGEQISANDWIRRDVNAVLNLLQWKSMIVMVNVTKTRFKKDGSHRVAVQPRKMGHTRVIHPDKNGIPHIVCWYPVTNKRSELVLTPANAVSEGIYTCREMIDDLHDRLYAGNAPAYLRKLMREVDVGPEKIDARRLVQIGKSPIHTLRQKKIEICYGDRAFQRLSIAVDDYTDAQSYHHNWMDEPDTAVIAYNKYPYLAGLPAFHRGTYSSSIPYKKQSTLRRCYHKATSR